MQNLEFVAQRMAELPFDTPEPRLSSDAPDKKYHNLSRTSMQNLKSLAQKMAELLH